MRVILDARRCNRRFRAAPPVSLVTAEGLANIAVDGDGGSEQARALGAGVALAIADVQNAFHYLKIGLEYGQYFCYPFEVTAKEMGLVGHIVEGVRCTPTTSFWLCASALPMGHSWSLYFCQRSLELRAARVRELDDCTIMQDRGPSVLLKQRPVGRNALRIFDPASGSHYYIYVDNLGF